MVDGELHFLLIQCYNYNNRLLARKTMAAGLHLLSGQPKILECLWEADGSTPGDLSRHCALDKSTVTGLLARMEEQELIRRDTQDTDRRISRVFLTDEGRKQAQRVRQVCAQVDEQAWRGISERDRQRTVAVLEHLLQNLEEVKKS